MLSHSCRLFRICSVVLLFPAGVIAATNSDTIIFGGSTNYAPHYYRDNQGQMAGFDIDLISIIAERNGWNVEFRFDDWDVIQSELAAGNIDIVPMFYSSSRGEKYQFSDPVFIETHYLYGNMSSASIRSLEELDGMRVAGETEAYALQELDRLGINATIVATNSEMESVRLAGRGEVDYALSPSVPADFIVSRESIPLVRLSPPLLPVAYAFAINPQKPKLQSLLNDSLEELNREGVIDALSRRWLDPDNANSFPWFYWVVLPLIALAALSLYWLQGYRHKLVSTRARLLSKSKELRAEKKKHKASTGIDSLTSLFTRDHFLHKAGKALDHARGNGSRLVFCVFTIRGIELIQHSRGYELVDELIVQFGKELGTKDYGICGYFGQGEFALIMEGVKDQNYAVNRLTELILSLQVGYHINNVELQPRISMGMIIFEQGSNDVYELLRKAQLALKVSETSTEAIVIYDASMEPDQNEIDLMEDLKEVLGNEGLSWAYQPQLNVRSGQIESAELLIRWNHPCHGWIPPVQFIPQAEQNGLIDLVTRAVVKRGIGTIKQWRREGIPCNLSINISANDLAARQNVDYMIEAFREFSKALTLEITETALMKDIDAIIANVDIIKKEGIRLALDDYGTGYSSMEYLKRFQFDEIKIDRMFIKNLINSTRDRKLTQASINLGHDLGALVVAEGVEDMKTAQQLIDMECDLLQGYGICKPVPKKEFKVFRDNFSFEPG